MNRCQSVLTQLYVTLQATRHMGYTATQLQHYFLCFSILVFMTLSLPINGAAWKPQFHGWTARDWLILVFESSVAYVGSAAAMQVRRVIRAHIPVLPDPSPWQCAHAAAGCQCRRHLHGRVLLVRAHHDTHIARLWRMLLRPRRMMQQVQFTHVPMHVGGSNCMIEQSASNGCAVPPSITMCSSYTVVKSARVYIGVIMSCSPNTDLSLDTHRMSDCKFW